MEKGGQVVMTVNQADKPVPPARIMSPVASSSWSRPEGAVLRHRERARAVATSVKTLRPCQELARPRYLLAMALLLT